MNILILYGSSEGQTAQIAQRITELIREKGHQVTVQSGDDLPGGAREGNEEEQVASRSRGSSMRSRTSVATNYWADFY